MPRYTYDYYRVSIPADCFNDIESAGLSAIEQASEATRLYTIPALWSAILIKGKLGDCGDLIFKVCRKRIKH